MANEINTFSIKDCSYILVNEFFDIDVEKFVPFAYFLFDKYLSNIYDTENCVIIPQYINFDYNEDNESSVATITEDPGEADPDAMVIFTMDLKLKNDVLYHYTYDELSWVGLLNLIVSQLLGNAEKIFPTKDAYNDLTFNILADMSEYFSLPNDEVAD